MWRSALKILRTDSRLIPNSWLRRRTDLLGLWTTESLTAATLCGVLDDFGRPEWLSVSVFTIEVMHSPMGSELVDPSVDHWVDRKFTTSEPFCELQLSCVVRLLPKICHNYKYLLLSSPRHLEGQIWWTLRTLILLGTSEKWKELINYFKSYSNLGDDRFFVSPCTWIKRQRKIERAKVVQSFIFCFHSRRGSTKKSEKRRKLHSPFFAKKWTFSIKTWLDSVNHSWQILATLYVWNTSYQEV